MHEQTPARAERYVGPATESGTGSRMDLSDVLNPVVLIVSFVFIVAISVIDHIRISGICENGNVLQPGCRPGG